MEDPNRTPDGPGKHPDPIPHMLGNDARNPEDPYFFNLDRELIEQRRRGLDARRAKQTEASQGAEYWMRCPKCGSSMTTSSFSQIRVDRCTGCDGVFLDQGEVEMVLELHEPNRFLNAITRIFDPGDVNPNLF
jgi:uncharacterized protein